MEIPDQVIRGEMLRQVQARGVAKSICPSEVARALAPQWQSLMGRVRIVAAGLARERKIEILRKGQPIDPDQIRGVVRLRHKPDG